MVLLEKLSAFAQKLMFKSKDYKEYDLEVEGDHTSRLEYYMYIYAGNEKLRFLIDSGAHRSGLGYKYLKYFKHIYLFQGATQGINGIVYPNREELIMFSLESGYKEENLAFDIFAVESQKTAPLFSKKCVGVLGATFLSRCEVDFRNAKIRVYPTSGKVVEALNIPKFDAVIQKGIDGLKQEVLAL